MSVRSGLLALTLASVGGIVTLTIISVDWLMPVLAKLIVAGAALCLVSSAALLLIVIAYAATVTLRAGIVRAPGDVPVHVIDVAAGWSRRHPARLVAYALDREQDIRLEAARQSALPALRSLRISGADQHLPAPVDTPAVFDDVASYDTADTADSIVIGYDAHQRPHVLRWGSAGVSAILGRSGSGKTATARALLIQAAQRGVRIALVDPHAAASDDESLAASCAPLRAALLDEPAATYDAALRLIGQIDQIGRARVRGTADRWPIVLVIDEFTALALRDDGRIIAPILNIAHEYRKVGLQAWIIAHSWDSRLVHARYGTALRAALGLRIVHRIDPQQAAFVLPEPHARDARDLKIGEALLLNSDGASARVRVPYVSRDDVARVQLPEFPPVALPTISAQPLAGDDTSYRDTTSLRDRLRLLRTRGVTREQARREYGLSFDNADWSAAEQ